MSSADTDLQKQWGNPRDILSLLLLVGGDIVQKAIAQLVGHQIHPFGKKGPAISITPVAFSFGWVAYSFSCLLSALGDMALMPVCDYPCILVNANTGFARENRSWALGRLLRDHEVRHEVDPRSTEDGGKAESIRIDIFNLLPVKNPSRDFVWWLGWITILIQLMISIIPWAVYGDWETAVITVCGTFLALTTSAMPQWIQEKWPPGRVQKRYKVTCLTRGNGSRHIMVFIGTQGSWDLEYFAAGMSIPRPETRMLSVILAIAWSCLLVTVSGIQYHTWYLVCIGAIGMVQNLVAAGASRAPGTGNFHLEKFSRAPTIIGRRDFYKDDVDAEVDLKETEDGLADLSSWVSGRANTGLTIGDNKCLPIHHAHQMPLWLETMSTKDGAPAWLEPAKPELMSSEKTVLQPSFRSTLEATLGQKSNTRAVTHSVIYRSGGIHGALIELEKWVPTVGLAMLQIFFPRGLIYNDETVRDNIHKRFWRQAYNTRMLRFKAEVQKRESSGAGLGV